MVPFAKTGGLGDVVGALPVEMAKAGHDVMVMIPHYDFVETGQPGFGPLRWCHTVNIGERQDAMTSHLTRDRKSGMQVCFLGNRDYFGRGGLYGNPDTKEDYADNDQRFSFFSRSVLEATRRLEFRPDIVHLHDWQAALIAVYLQTVYADDPFFAGVKTVLTIHNLAHQGGFDADRFRLLGLPDRLLMPTAPMEFFGKSNFLKVGIVTADLITTVSPRYAREIQTGKFGCGLDGVLRERADDLRGILNGVDYTIWTPSRDRLLPHKYYPANLSGKRMNKIDLLRASGLPIRDDVPLVGMISRLVYQKGLDLIREAADRLFAMDLQMVALGTGDEKYHKLLRHLETKYPDKLKVYLVHDEKLAHWIEGAADVFLMPSLFEPCGLNQMYSLKYGTVPIVNEVGGLADTVVDYDSDTAKGTGFVFNEETPEAMLDAVERATIAFRRKRPWMKLMKNGMKQDFSWPRSVRQYLSEFETLIARQ